VDDADFACDASRQGSLRVTTWQARSPTVAAMLNPALLASVICAATEEYVRAGNEAMPWPLAFLAAPLVLHHETREALPRSTRSHWSNWVSEHVVLSAGFAGRAASLVEPVREGVRYALRTDSLRVSDNGGLIGGLVVRARPAAVGDIAEIIKASGFVGKWLAKLDSPATAFALLGVAS